MAAAITTAGMIAQTSAMEVATNDVGQVLLGGAYFVENGYSTDLVIVNTRTDAAVQAKVVFRSHLKSAEVLDFFIWLSPADTFRATLTDDGGKLHINSADDSVRNLNDTAWGDTDALDFTVSGDKVTATGDSTTFGHFEVISYLTAGSGTAYATPSAITVTPGMTKDDVKALMAGGTRSADADQCTPAQLSAADVISTMAPCSTELMAEVVIKNANNRGSYKATALRNSAGTGAAAVAGYVIANPAITMVTSQESLVGAQWEAAGGEWINQVEMALAAFSSSYPWESNGTDQGTHAVGSFVTKYRHEGDLVGFCGANSAGGRVAGAADQYSAPFADTTTGEVEILFTNYDNSERTSTTPGNTVSGGLGASATSLPNEVNYITPTYVTSETSGWAYFTWVGSDTATCSYTGVPVVAYSYKFEANSDFRHMIETMSNKQIIKAAP